MAMIFAPCFFACSSEVSMRGWLVPGFWPDDEDHVGLLEVLERDRPLPYPQALDQRGAGRLVTHVGAVGHVVGAELPHEELVEERRLVAGATGGVEGGVIGRGQRAQHLADVTEGLVPGDRLVVRGALAAVEGLDEATLRVEPLVGLPGELVDGPLAEELGADGALASLARHRLGAVLTELELVALAVGRGPGAALAIEAVLLVDAEEGLLRADDAESRQRDAKRTDDGGEAGGGLRRRADRGERGLDGRLGKERRGIPGGWSRAQLRPTASRRAGARFVGLGGARRMSRERSLLPGA